MEPPKESRKNEARPGVATLTLEVTYRCHRRCSFCYVPNLLPADADAESMGELPAQELVRLIALLVEKTGCRNVQLSGGEPLLHPSLTEIIEPIQALPARVSIITDLGPLDRTLALWLAARPTILLQPTLLSGTADLHDGLRGPGSFDEATRAIALATGAGLEVTVSVVVTRLNFGEMDAVATLAFALGARGLAISRFCPAGAAAAAFDSLMPDAGQVRTAVEAAVRACRRLGLRINAALTIPRCVFEDPARPPLPTGVCSLVGPRTTLTLGPDGGIRTCSMSTTSAGSLLAEPCEMLLRRLWEKEVAPLRSSSPAECEGCAHFSICLSGCRLSALGAFGTFDRSDPLAPMKR